MSGEHISLHYGYCYHHGIDCGDGTVSHLSKEHGDIVRSPYAEFADWHTVYINGEPSGF